jgi:glycine hydroxymethyltransferase
MRNLLHTDPEIARAISEETRRQGAQLELIASENFVSEAVLEALGTVLTNKYAEGYPGKRYYGGCEVVDVVETLAIERVKKLFGCDPRERAAPFGRAGEHQRLPRDHQAGETILGMNLSHGGHLTHGHPLNFSGLMYNVVAYGVRQEDERLDYEQMLALAKEHNPKVIVVGASAYPRTIDFAAIRAAADACGAIVFADIAHIAGLVVAGLHPSPIPHADFVTTTTHKTLRGPRGGLAMCTEKWAKNLDRAVFPGMQGGTAHARDRRQGGLLPGGPAARLQGVPAPDRGERAGAGEDAPGEGLRLVSGGTDNHLLLIDVFAKGVTGKVAEKALDRAGITVNKNTIPFDQNSPMVASGIRVGTPALTTRGMKEADMETVGRLIARAIGSVENESELAAVKRDVQKLCERFPLYAAASKRTKECSPGCRR